ncbi:MAG: four helix bundle protein [bacterium]|nr:four helix bundle protein [bacterium]
MDKFRFLKWRVYQEAKGLLALILKIVKKLPREYRYELGSQIIRSAFSVILNIAEGSGKTSDKELNRFIEIALGSVNETLAGADVLNGNNLATDTEFREVYLKCDSISNQLGGFKKKLQK